MAGYFKLLMLHRNLFIIFSSTQAHSKAIHTHAKTYRKHTLTSAEKSFFTLANISTNVDTLLKGTHITIKWNKEGTPHATLFILRKEKESRKKE